MATLIPFRVSAGRITAAATRSRRPSRPLSIGVSTYTVSRTASAQEKAGRVRPFRTRRGGAADAGAAGRRRAALDHGRV
ncbi:hypothetical protein [Nonomuraea sp. NPDC001699]